MAQGSSPRVRGKPNIRTQFTDNRGLIPACAGKTAPRVADRRDERAHPRVCGENPTITHSRVLGTGSSPRVRGKQAGTSLLGDGRGLIPACAGKTKTIFTTSRPSAAHPRVCGENVEDG